MTEETHIRPMDFTLYRPFSKMPYRTILHCAVLYCIERSRVAKNSILLSGTECTNVN
jgi:hypothetical protein